MDKNAIPWFLHSFVKPPSDPVTVQLLALVEDLPSVPGPKTVGSENYSRILNAFETAGWAGFEEEFDRLVPRDRADYVDVKHELLREPVFSLKVHRNIVEALQAANEDLHEVCDWIFARPKATGATAPEKDPDDKPLMWRY